MKAKKGRSRASGVFGILLGFALILPVPSGGQVPDPVVHAILFWSPSCAHCHALINDHLIPLQEEYGRRFVILAFDVTQGWANEIYWAALRKWEVPQSDWVVPILLVKEELLIGGNEIPTRLRTIIEEGLAGDGVDLPDFPALMTFLEEGGVLDPRYPDRRIALQAPVEGQEPVEETPEPRQEVAAAGDPAQVPEGIPPAADTSGVAISPPAGAEAGGAADSTAGSDLGPIAQVDSGGAPATTSPADSGSALSTPPQAVAGPPTATPPVGAMADEDSSAVPSAEPLVDEDPSAVPPAGSLVDEATAEGVEDVAAGGVPVDSPAPVPPASTLSPAHGAGGTESMGLARAVQVLESRSMVDRFNQDRTGNSLSVVILLGMLASLVLRGFPPRVRGRPWPLWVVPALVLVGTGVAAYLSFIEVTHTEAVCGPVGDCNTVNQSEYATLFGILPVGVLGLLGYASILVLWILGRWGPGRMKGPADLALWGAAVFGILFSVYLTFLEPFVIGATCAWCLSSAVIMTLLLWATAPMAARAWPGTPGVNPS